MNKGVSLCKGDWIYFLGADDELIDENVFQSIFSKEIAANVSLLAGDILYKGNASPFIYSKKKKIKKASWSLSIWIRNCLHHQGTFYRKELFVNEQYNLKYKVLSDYAFNIKLYKLKAVCYLTNSLIAVCNGNGVSKDGSIAIYKEEINLKVEESHWIFAFLHYSISLMKYLILNLRNAYR